MRDFIHTDLTDLNVTEQHVRALALLLTHCPDDGIDGEDADPGAAQELRDLEAAGTPLPWAVL